MKKLIFTITILSASFLFVSGQSGVIQGSIIDASSGTPVSYATVALSKAGTDEALTGTVSGLDGTFRLESIPFGSYQVVVSFIGYRSAELSSVILSAEGRLADLGSIELEPEAFGIEAVEVTTAVRTSTDKIDRRTYRAADFETARGGTAEDILSKLPSVTINGEYGILVRGSSDFVVYLNGKPTNTPPSVLLGQITAENIESIDIITVPTSRYEAQGKAGIINITTKRPATAGLTIQTTGMMGGTPWKNGTDVFSNHTLNNNRVNGGLIMNYNFNRINLHGAVNYTHRNNKGIGDIYTYMYQDESQSNSGTWYILDGGAARPKWDETLYTNVGADIQLGENADLSANYQYSRRHAGRAAHYKYDTYFAEEPAGDPIDGTLYELYNPNDIHRRGSFQNFSIDYRLKPDANNSFSASFLFEDSDLEQTIRNKEFPYAGQILYYDYYSEEPGDPVFHSFQSDRTPLRAYRGEVNFGRAFENGSTLNLGGAAQFVRLDGFYEYDTVNTSTGQFEGFDYFNNNIDLSRDIFAAFAEYKGSSGALSYIFGLRFEYLDQQMNVSSTQYFQEVYEVFGALKRDFNETRFHQQKPDLFPSFHLAYTAGDANTFTISASRRINRPPAKNMAPFLYRRHQEIFEMGDPLLEPEYSWNSDLSYNRVLGKHAFTLTGFVRSATNAIYRVNRLDYDLANIGGVLLRSYTNAGSQLATGGELDLNLFLFNQLKIFAGGSLYQFSVESNEELFGDQSSSSSLNWDIKSNLSWQIIPPLELTVDYLYTSNTVTPQGENIAFQMMNVIMLYTPERRTDWRFYIKMLDVLGTDQSGGFTGATEGATKLFRRDWVYDYEGQILELGATFTFNKLQEERKLKMIGTDYF